MQSPSPCWDMILACRRGCFYYSVLWPQSTSRVSLFWMLLAMDCSRTGEVATGAHCLHPNVTAPAICPLLCGAGLPAACRAIRACPAAARPPEEKKLQRKKVPFLLCLPPFHMHNLTFCCVLGRVVFFFFITPLLLFQAHQKFAGSCVHVRMPNNFISCLEESQHGVHRAGGGCWGAFSFLPHPSCPPFASAGLLWVASSALPLHFIFIPIS